ncbi:MAG: nitrilase-related carbon-nitrogen hydrolase [Chitinophagaceae bacterium]
MKKRMIKNIVLLLIGASFHYFSNGRYAFALAAWLFPFFFLLVSRKEKSIYSWLIIPLLVGISCQLAFWKFTYDNTSSVLFFLPFLLGLPMGFLFFLDRLLYSKNKGFPATLIFPFLYTSFDFLLNLFNPFGTLGILGYSQFDFLAFSQLASITGMWGLTFMITWFGSAMYWVLENYPFKQTGYQGITIYISLLILILVYGSIRLNTPAVSTVKIAGIHMHDKDIEGRKMNEFLEKKDTVSFKTVSDTIIDRLIQETIKQSDAGAKIIVWSEISSKVLKRDEDSLIAVFKHLALQQNIYLITCPYTINSDSDSKPENKVLLFSPGGELVLIHYKYGGNFMEGTVAGDQIIKAVNTEYGRLSAIICWDGDFPSIVKQVGKLQSDILFVPASDWEQIDPAHSVVTVFRGIENGCSVIRQTRNGLSIITDPGGKIISQMDHFENTSWVTVGQVPNKKWFTLYPITGDLFGWLSFPGILYFVFQTLTRRKETERQVSQQATFDLL